MTRITLNLRDTICEELQGTSLSVPAEIDIAELCDFNDLHEAELDLEDLLLTNRMIGQFWATGDLQNIRPDLSEEQAWQVLQQADGRQNPHDPISLEVLSRIAESLFPSPPTSGQRAVRVNRTIVTYGEDIAESNLIDLLSDAMHWCRSHGQEFSSFLATAAEHYQAEIGGQP